MYNSPVQADVVRALGGTPANLGFGWIDEVRAGSLRGAEFDIAQYAKNDNSTEAGHVTANVVLWPKVFVLSLEQAAVRRAYCAAANVGARGSRAGRQGISRRKL